MTWNCAYVSWREKCLSHPNKSGIHLGNGYFVDDKEGYMKKLLIRISIGVIALVVVAVLVSMFFIGRVVKNRIESIGPRVVLAEVKLDSADVWLLAGRAQLKGLSIGNPPGYTTPVAIKVGDISIRVDLASVLSHKVIIDSVTVKSPEITVEGGWKKNNLTEIQKNVNAYVSRHPDTPPSEPKPAASPSAAGKPGKKFQINDLFITGTRLRLTGLFSTGASLTLPLPDIHLVNLGAGEAGLTSPEIAQKALAALLDSIATNTAASTVKKIDFKKAAETMKALLGH